MMQSTGYSTLARTTGLRDPLNALAVGVHKVH